MHRVASGRWLVIVLAASLLAGCDVMGSTQTKGPPPKTLSHAQFVRAADSACARAERKTRAFKKSANLAVVEAELRNVFIPAQEHLLVVFRQLTPPRADAAGFQQMLGTFDRLDLAIHQLLDAADAQQVGRGKQLVARLDLLGKRLDAQAAKLGLPTCARD
jgi:uncharacterized lipoprotein YajG